MRLTQILCKYHPGFVGLRPKFRGSATKGAHCWIRPATKGDRYMLWQRWKEEEQVEKYTSKPYITADEELDYLETLGQRSHDVDPLYTSKIESPMRQRYAVEIIEVFERSRSHETHS